MARQESYVEVCSKVGRTERFNAVVLTLHSDEALALLSQPSEVEWDPWSRPDLVGYR